MLTMILSFSREQFNVLTSFVDASHLYGSTDEKARELRTLTGGLMKENDGLLPFEKSHCDNGGDMPKTFFAGDERVNENPGLQSLHTLLMREHNRIAKKMAESSGVTDDEVLYQEAKRLVTAQWQNIIYSEWLPLVLGPRLMER